MTEPTCQICHKNAPTDGFQVCDTCKGFDPLAARIEIDPTAKPIGHCLTCGADGWEPYKIGKATIKAGICYSCVMRKKYGSDWVPGGNVARRKAYAAKYREKKKAMKQIADKIMEESGKMIEAENGTQQKPFYYSPTESEAYDVTIYFVDNGDDSDIQMFKKIQAIAKKERRTLEQQIIYLLDGVL